MMLLSLHSVGFLSNLLGNPLIVMSNVYFPGDSKSKKLTELAITQLKRSKFMELPD